MNRKFQERDLILATHNFGKIEEFKHLFGEVNFNIMGIGQYSGKTPEETAGSFWENSLIKAREATKLTGLVSLADDSGLCVDILNGAPGIYSADWAIKSDGSRDFNFATNRLVREIEKNNFVGPCTAYFICSLILYWPDNHFEKFEGKIYGEIVWPGKGEKGHGYDPVFLPSGYEETFGQMDRWKKNKISHRGLAMNKLLDSCF
jgi:XTP/dITP diphosphohydrolase